MTPDDQYDLEYQAKVAQEIAYAILDASMVDENRMVMRGPEVLDALLAVAAEMLAMTNQAETAEGRQEMMDTVAERFEELMTKTYEDMQKGVHKSVFPKPDVVR